MNVLFPVLVTFFAGMGAGLGTGFAGMSAAAVITPMLITFLHMDPYMAVGIALSSDVLQTNKPLQNMIRRVMQRLFCTLKAFLELEKEGKTQ